MSLTTEKQAFEEMLPQLLKEHQGEWVLMRGGEVIGFFPEFATAHDEGVEKFGPEETFLVTDVVEEAPVSISLAWEAGVLVGNR